MRQAVTRAAQHELDVALRRRKPFRVELAGPDVFVARHREEDPGIAGTGADPIPTPAARIVIVDEDRTDVAGRPVRRPIAKGGALVLRVLQPAADGADAVYQSPGRQFLDDRIALKNDRIVASE